MERVIEKLQERGIKAIIPSKENHKIQRVIDKEIYKERRLIENFFCKLKQFRGIATRYDKTALIFCGAVFFVASLILMN